MSSCCLVCCDCEGCLEDDARRHSLCPTGAHTVVEVNNEMFGIGSASVDPECCMDVHGFNTETLLSSGRLVGRAETSGSLPRLLQKGWLMCSSSSSSAASSFEQFGVDGRGWFFRGGGGAAGGGVGGGCGGGILKEEDEFRCRPQSSDYYYDQKPLIGRRRTLPPC